MGPICPNMHYIARLFASFDQHQVLYVLLVLPVLLCLCFSRRPACATASFHLSSLIIHHSAAQPPRQRPGPVRLVRPVRLAADTPCAGVNHAFPPFPSVLPRRHFCLPSIAPQAQRRVGRPRVRPCHAVALAKAEAPFHLSLFERFKQ